jgi:predicted DNA-binding transcriptional regulator AlpA
MEPLLDMESVGKLLGLSRSQVYELCRNRRAGAAGTSDPGRQGRKVSEFRASSLNEWIQKLEQNATAAKAEQKAR